MRCTEIPVRERVSMSLKRRLSDWLLLSAVRYYCFVRHPVIMAHAISANGYFPNPSNPQLIGDKFLWRKLFDRNPLFTVACDKLASKKYVSDLMPELNTAKVLWTGTNPDEIPDELLCGDTVIKANHGSGWNLLIREGDVIDSARLHERARFWLARQYGRRMGEWGYSVSARKLIVEEMLINDGRPIQAEYKFHVCGGKVAYVYTSTGGSGDNQQFVVLDREGNGFKPTPDGKGRKISFKLPKQFGQMVRVAEQLSQPFDFARLDLYDLQGQTYFSEITIYPLSGTGNIRVKHLTTLRNQMWDIRKSWFFASPQRGWRRYYAAALKRSLDAKSAAY